jgi:dihydroorotase
VNHIKHVGSKAYKLFCRNALQRKEYGEPGYGHKETIADGARAAAKGGFTSICCMPNTNPAVDCGELVSFVKRKAEEAPYAKVYPIGAVTRGQNGKELSAIEEMAAAGACALSEDGKSVDNTFLLKQALQICLKKPLGQQ